MKKVVLLVWLVCAIAGLIAVFVSCSSTEKTGSPGQAASIVTSAGESLTLDSANIDVETKEALKPVAFTAGDGRKGWKITIPGNRPIATPAYADGMIFVGGGYGSHEFYAFDAKTGELEWQMKTKDDGPTAAVVSEGCVVFNTESCTLVVAEAKTGREIWSKWLGDPLMSQPSVADGKVYMVYPGDGKHYLACFTLMKGEQAWKAEISGDAISAPIIDEGSVYVATFDGNLYRFDAGTGKQLWCKKEQITSAPWMHKDRVYASQRSGEEQKITEGMMAFRNGDGAQFYSAQSNSLRAPYLDRAANAGSVIAGEQKSLDSGVGFLEAPATAKLADAASNVGQSTVVGCWAYQGARPCVQKGRCYTNSGNTLQCLDIESNKVIWERKYEVENEEKLGWIALTPPSVVNGRMFTGSITGELFCVEAESGKPVWSYKVNEPVMFQPSIAKGRAYFGTQSGSIYCVETGDEKDDGWYMWGGNASHNGLAK